MQYFHPYNSASVGTQSPGSTQMLPQQCGPYGYPGIPPDIFLQVVGYTMTAEHEIAQLQYELRQKTDSEQSYREALQLNGTTCVLDRRGRPTEIANCTFPRTFRVESQPPLRGDTFFLIWTSVSEIPLRISQTDFFHDTKFIAALHSLPGVKITLVKSQKKTASLLRLAIMEHTEAISRQAYAGWQQNQDGYHFHLFSNRSSHQGQEQFLPLATRVSQSPDFSVTAAVSAEQFWPVFRLVTDRYTRQVVVLWFYIAQLYTLLRMLGFEMPMALYLFTPDHDITSYLRELFSWYGDSAISPSLSAIDFNDELFNRRDQPLLLVDEGDSKRALANISNLEATLANRRLTWKSGRSLQSLPLQALPTIISARVSSISCVPETIVLDVSPDSFNWSGWVDLLDVIHNHAEHRNCFVRYTEAHVGELHTALMNERKLAIKISHGELSEACTQALGIFFGMQAFLPQFFRFCAPAVAPIRLDDDEIRSWLFTLMKQTAEKTFIASLSSQFLYVARQHIRNGVLKLCTRMHASDATNVVYADDERLHFPASAFFSVCQAMHQTRPVILRALATDGLLCGAQTNPGTAQTRIHVYNEHGIAKKIAVYSFDRSAIEDLGDPLPLGEEGHDEP